MFLSHTLITALSYLSGILFKNTLIIFSAIPLPLKSIPTTTSLIYIVLSANKSLESIIGNSICANKGDAIKIPTGLSAKRANIPPPILINSSMVFTTKFLSRN